MKKAKVTAPKNLLWGKYSHAVYVDSPLFGFAVIKRSFKEHDWNQASFIESISRFIVDQKVESIDDRIRIRKAGQVLKSDVENFLTLCEGLLEYEKKFGLISRGRSECNTFSFYSMTDDLATFLLEKCPQLVRKIARPASEEHAQLLKDCVTEAGYYKKYKTVKRLPDGKWRFRLYAANEDKLFDTHPGVKDVLINYYQNDLIHIPLFWVEAMVNNRISDWWNLTIQVADEDTLTMLIMAVGQQNISSIEEFVVYKS